MMELSTGFVLLAFIGLTSAAGWGYENNGAAKWAETFEDCGKKSQSPIDIQTADVVHTPELGNITMTGYDVPTSMKLSNNGHTAKVSVVGNLTISSGGLPESYRAAQFHFHWGSDDTKGSEHTINDNAYPMEMHIVHFKESLGSLGNSVGTPEGLAVLGFMFEIAPSDNPQLKNLIDTLDEIKYPNTSNEVSLTTASMKTLLPTLPNNFFRYSGSLTTPTCNEVVVWTVFAETIKISKSQMAKFRDLMSSEHDISNRHVRLQNNYRPVQALNSRRVLSNYLASSTTSVSFTLFSSILTVTVAYIFAH